MNSTCIKMSDITDWPFNNKQTLLSQLVRFLLPSIIVVDMSENRSSLQWNLKFVSIDTVTISNFFFFFQTLLVVMIIMIASSKKRKNYC